MVSRSLVASGTGEWRGPQLCAIAKPKFGGRSLSWCALGESARCVSSSRPQSNHAVVSAGTRGPARIFGIKGLSEVSRVQEDNPFDLPTVYAYRPPHITPRIPAQRSVFTVHPKSTDDFSAMTGIVSWLVEESACGKIKAILDASGVNESSLFPDLDGLSRYIGWRYKWGKF